MTHGRLATGVLAIALFGALAGCHKATFTRDVPPAGPTQSTWTNYWVFGLAGVAEIDVRDYCPDGDVRLVRTGGNVATGLVSVVTMGIYTPRKVWIECGATGAVAEAGAVNAPDRGGAGAERPPLRLMRAPEGDTWVAYWGADGADREGARGRGDP